MRRIGFIAFPNFQVLSLSTLSVFECANILAPEPLYGVRILSETGGPIRTSSGLALETERFDEKEFHTLIVLGTLVDEPTFSPGHAIKNSASYDATIREKLKEDSCRTSGILASSPTA